MLESELAAIRGKLGLPGNYYVSINIARKLLTEVETSRAQLKAAEEKIERLTWVAHEATDSVLHNPSYLACRFCHFRKPNHLKICPAAEREGE